jgi:hypothetical protein
MPDRCHGHRVRRLELGVGEWRLAGLPVATSAEPGATRAHAAIGTGTS